METITKSIDVNAPLQTVYNQWTQFEEFPRFMEGVESVKQLDDTHLHWVAEIGGKEHSWDAEISHQEPDRRVAWRARDGKYVSGEVTFEPPGTPLPSRRASGDLGPEVAPPEPALEPARELGGRQRAGEEVALRRVAAE